MESTPEKMELSSEEREHVDVVYNSADEVDKELFFCKHCGEVLDKRVCKELASRNLCNLCKGVRRGKDQKQASNNTFVNC